MNTKQVIAAACALAGASRVFAGTITFDDAPATFRDTSSGGSGHDLGSYYQGVTFGSGAQITATIPGVFPAHSDGFELANQFGPSITAAFATPQMSLSFWYTTAASMTITTFDSSHAVLSSVTLAANPGTDNFASVTDLSPNIASVSITSTSGLGNLLTIDDFSAPGVSGLAAPDAASTLGLLGLAATGLLAFRRKFARQNN